MFKSARPARIVKAILQWASNRSGHIIMIGTTETEVYNACSRQLVRKSGALPGWSRRAARKRESSEQRAQSAQRERIGDPSEVTGYSLSLQCREGGWGAGGGHTGVGKQRCATGATPRGQDRIIVRSTACINRLAGKVPCHVRGLGVKERDVENVRKNRVQAMSCSFRLGGHSVESSGWQVGPPAAQRRQQARWALCKHSNSVAFRCSHLLAVCWRGRSRGCRERWRCRCRCCCRRATAGGHGQLGPVCGPGAAGSGAASP